MREIKFRVWDKDKKTLLYPDKDLTTGEVIDGKTGKHDYYHCVGWTDTVKIGLTLHGVLYKQCCNSQEIIKNPILQQFTGLKDKNGVNIYEGDQLRLENGEISEVTFHHGSFYIFGTSISKWLIIEKTMMIPYVEIVGNVLENPELCEK